jgi:hypothetical protein
MHALTSARLQKIGSEDEVEKVTIRSSGILRSQVTI